jgi:hypothetical protein
MEVDHKTTGGELINIDGKTLRGAKEVGNSHSLIQYGECLVGNTAFGDGTEKS